MRKTTGKVTFGENANLFWEFPHKKRGKSLYISSLIISNMKKFVVCLVLLMQLTSACWFWDTQCQTAELLGWLVILNALLNPADNSCHSSPLDGNLGYGAVRMNGVETGSMVAKPNESVLVEFGNLSINSRPDCSGVSCIGILRSWGDTSEHPTIANLTTLCVNCGHCLSSLAGYANYTFTTPADNGDYKIGLIGYKTDSGVYGYNDSKNNCTLASLFNDSNWNDGIGCFDKFKLINVTVHQCETAADCSVGSYCQNNLCANCTVGESCDSCDTYHPYWNGTNCSQCSGEHVEVCALGEKCSNYNCVACGWDEDCSTCIQRASKPYWDNNASTCVDCMTITNDNTYVNRDLFLCQQTYNINDNGNGVLIFNSSATVNCNGAVFSGNGSGYFAYIDGKSDVGVKNCEVKNYNTAIYAQNANNVKALNNVIHDLNEKAIYYKNITNGLIFGNNITDVLVPTPPWYIGVIFVNSSNMTNITNNYVYKTTVQMNGGITAEGSDNILVNGNKVVDAAYTGYGIRLNGTKNSMAEDNDVSGAGDTALLGIAYSQNITIRRNKIYNNTITGGWFGIDYLRGGQNIYSYENYVHYNLWGNRYDTVGNLNLIQQNNTFAVNLISPTNNTNASGTVLFQFNASNIMNYTQGQSSTTICNLSLDGSFVAGNSSVLDNTETNISVDGVSGSIDHTWYVYCYDSNTTNNNTGTSPTYTINPGSVGCMNITNDDTYVNGDLSLCPGNYNIIDANNNGVLIFNVSATVNCNGAVFSGNGSGYFAYINGINNVGVKNCEIENYTMGVFANNSQNVETSGNYLHDMNLWADNDRSPIYYNNVTTGLIYNNNLTRVNTGDLNLGIIHVENSDSVNITENRINITTDPYEFTNVYVKRSRYIKADKNNISLDAANNGFWGIMFDSTNHSKIEENIISGRLAPCAALLRVMLVDNVTIRGNTIYNNTGLSSWGLDYGNGGTNIVSTQNYIHHNRYSVIYLNNFFPFSLIQQNNTFAVDLLSPADGSLANGTVAFTFNATNIMNYTQNQSSTTICNLSIDGVWNASNSSVLDNTPTTFIVNNVNNSEHQWYVYCYDSNVTNNNTGNSTTFTINPLIGLGMGSSSSASSKSLSLPITTTPTPTSTPVPPVVGMESNGVDTYTMHAVAGVVENEPRMDEVKKEDVVVSNGEIIKRVVSNERIEARIKNAKMVGYNKKPDEIRKEGDEIVLVWKDGGNIEYWYKENEKQEKGIIESLVEWLSSLIP